MQSAWEDDVKEPVAIGGSVIALLNAAIVVVVVMGWYPLTPEQIAGWNALIVALVAVATYVVRTLTTPLAKPEDGDRMPLVRADNQEPSKLAAAAGRRVVVEGPEGTTVGEARSGVKGRLVWSK
jgi:hypothetical protein